MYNTKEYAEDRKIAGFVFNDCFKTFRWLKDDLIQSAVIRLWQFRKDHRMYFTGTGAREVARRAMIDLLRQERRYLDDISIFEEIEEDLCLLDTFESENKNSDIEVQKYLCLRKKVNKKFDTLQGKERKIIQMYLNRRSFDEIGAYVGTAKQNVSRYVKNFRKSIFDEVA